VERMLPAKGAVFLELRSLSLFLLIPRARVIPPLALRAGKANDFSHSLLA
jgi:hypothetical protein